MRHTPAFRTLAPLAVLAVTACCLPVAAGHAVRAAQTDCPTEEVCVWSGAGYTGTLTTIQDETCDPGQVGSALNRDPDTLQELRVYPRPGCTGTPTVLKSGAGSAGVSGQSYQNWHDPNDPAGP